MVNQGESSEIESPEESDNFLANLDNGSGDDLAESSESSVEDEGVSSTETQEEETVEQKEEEVVQPQDSNDPIVEMSDGNQVPLSELKDSYLRRKDYTVKTQQVAEARKVVEQGKVRYEQYYQALQEQNSNLHKYLEDLIPDMPDINLARSNPQQYQYQKALREQAITELNQVMARREGLDKGEQMRRQQEMHQFAQHEEAQLMQTFPQLRDGATKQKFARNLMETAKEFGFSENEIRETLDHRVLAMVHYASIGRRASSGQNKTSKPLSAAPQRKASVANINTGKNRKAMAQLKKSGSMADALKVDFA